MLFSRKDWSIRFGGAGPFVSISALFQFTTSAKSSERERERGEDKSMANTGADKKGNEDRTASKAGRAAADD